MSDVLSRLRTLEQQATPGPWELDTHRLDGDTLVAIKSSSVRQPAYVCELGGVEDESSRVDSALIVEARNLLPALLDIAEAARDLLEEAKDLSYRVASEFGVGAYTEEPQITAMRVALARLDREGGDQSE